VAKKGEEVEKRMSEAKLSQSFTMNLFRGVVETAQVFPFPQVLNEEQTDNLKMLVDPTAKFFEVCICCIRQCNEEKRCIRLITLSPSCAVVKKSGNLNFLEPSGPLRACNGTALPFTEEKGVVFHYNSMTTLSVFTYFLFSARLQY